MRRVSLQQQQLLRGVQAVVTCHVVDLGLLFPSSFWPERQLHGFAAVMLRRNVLLLGTVTVPPSSVLNTLFLFL
jgi:hypothetical protein